MSEGGTGGRPGDSGLREGEERAAEGEGQGKEDVGESILMKLQTEFIESILTIFDNTRIFPFLNYEKKFDSELQGLQSVNLITISELQDNIWS